ncbi:hypothetical protein MUN82_10555 [Hymenobacter aerilatus]|uniref:Uncharacterized protein n=1 Tax=Hymenobacter aerilatus TaxID=2932251 RepID=A0A8T9T060_9BACT|nr:hypothetical protein [Hymenobacter aerilatus]UOR07515.1 hypothetical protein MUN82_10555 [Hymenobacter aerilatus]
MFQVRFLLWVVLLIGWAPVAGWAQTETPAVANKRLFDRTVDELNFRTMETVYDKTFTRRKFPVSLRTQQQRKQFDDFNGNTDLKKLFLNYNDLSERFKSRFGKGRTDLAEFERQLNGLLIDKNFEFFISVIPRDERIALIRAEQRIIKQATAQFNASQDPTPDELATDAATVPPADGTALPSGDAAELEDVAPQPEVVVPNSGGPIIRSADVPSTHDWFDYLTLALALGSSLGLLYVLTSVLPEMRARLNELDPTHATRSSDPLPSDRYEDE